MLISLDDIKPPKKIKITSAKQHILKPSQKPYIMSDLNLPKKIQQKTDLIILN